MQRSGGPEPESSCGQAPRWRPETQGGHPASGVNKALSKWGRQTHKQKSVAAVFIAPPQQKAGASPLRRAPERASDHLLTGGLRDNKRRRSPSSKGIKKRHVPEDQGSEPLVCDPLKSRVLTGNRVGVGGVSLRLVK